MGFTGPKPRPHSFGGSRGESVPYPFQLLMAANIPWLVAASLQSLPSLLLRVSNLLLLPSDKVHVIAFWAPQDKAGQSPCLCTNLGKPITSAKSLYHIVSLPFICQRIRVWSLWEPLFSLLCMPSSFLGSAAISSQPLWVNLTDVSSVSLLFIHSHSVAISWY